MKTSWLRQAVKKILNGLDCESPPPGLPREVDTLCLLFTDNAEICRLNYAYRGINKPTDVLSFSQLESLKAEPLSGSLGDIAISVEALENQAREAGCSRQVELLRLVLHGILHLFGYEHVKVSPARARLMRRKEKALLERYKN